MYTGQTQPALNSKYLPPCHLCQGYTFRYGLSRVEEEGGLFPDAGRSWVCFCVPAVWLHDSMSASNLILGNLSSYKDAVGTKPWHW